MPTRPRNPLVACLASHCSSGLDDIRDYGQRARFSDACTLAVGLSVLSFAVEREHRTHVQVTAVAASVMNGDWLMTVGYIFVAVRTSPSAANAPGYRSRRELEH